MTWWRTKNSWWQKTRYTWRTIPFLGNTRCRYSHFYKNAKCDVVHAESMRAKQFFCSSNTMTAAQKLKKALVALMNAANFHHESVLKSFSAIVWLPLTFSVRNDRIAKFDAEVRYIRQRLMAPAEFAQDLGRRRWAVDQSMIGDPLRLYLWKASPT